MSSTGQLSFETIFNDYVKSLEDALASISNDASQEDKNQINSLASVMFYQQLFKSIILFDSLSPAKGDFLRKATALVDEHLLTLDDENKEKFSQLFYTSLSDSLDEYFAKLKLNLSPEELGKLATHFKGKLSEEDLR